MVYIIPILVVLFPVVCALIFSIFYFKRLKRGRRSPITGNLLRGPGESLREELEKNLDHLENGYFRTFNVTLPPAALLFYFMWLNDNIVPIWQLGIVAVLYFFLIFWSIRKLIVVIKERRNLFLGLDAEIAVGQELNQLMLGGVRVFHDFPAENFNIDHIAIGPGGVFAIETKGRAKPDNGGGKADALIVFDGKRLNFPGWFETEPLAQAKRQAEWLSKWLSSAVGETVAVTGVVVLPGWFIERKGAGDVKVLSGKEIYHLKKMNVSRLTPEMIQRIAHQVEQRCRNVEPAAYKKDKKK